MAIVNEIEDVAQDIRSRAQQVPLSVGQIVCIGLEDVRTKLGETRWERTRDLVRKIADQAIGTVLGPKDTVMKARDGGYVIVFGDGNEVMAEAKAARIAQIVNQELFGEEDAQGVTVSGIVHSDRGLLPGEYRDPGEILDNLTRRACRKSLLPGKMPMVERPPASGAEPPDVGERIDFLSLAPSPRRTGVSAPTRDSAGDQNGGGLAGLRSEEVREALLSEFDTLQSSKVTIGYRPVWSRSGARVSVFNCLPFQIDPFAPAPVKGYDILGSDPSARDIVDLDMACLERGLLDQSRRLRQGHRQLVVFNLHYETLCDQKGKAQLHDLMNRSPSSLRQTIAFSLCHLPTGIPEGRLAQLLSPRTEWCNSVLASVKPRDIQDQQASFAARMRTSGVSTLVLDLKNAMQGPDLSLASQAVEAAGKCGMKAALFNLWDISALKAFAQQGVDLFAGPLFGGPFEQLPTVYSFECASLHRRSRLAAVIARRQATDMEGWSDIADRFKVVFAAIAKGRDGVLHFVHLSNGIARLSGYRAEELVGKPVSALQPEDMDENTSFAFFRRLETHGDAHARVTHLGKDANRYEAFLHAFRPLGMSPDQDKYVFAYFERAESPVRREEASASAARVRPRPSPMVLDMT
ncbi:MAG: hypothetical protein NXI16_07565 [Alphaproteobacteria bacterium]|nr:hypothetical protein [Alphaproteobacteria bacterium]